MLRSREAGIDVRTASARKLTYRDFLKFPDDGRRHELINGKHYVSPSPSLVHQRILGRLYLELATFLESRQVGEVFVAPLDVKLSNHDVVEPDLLVVLAEQSTILTDNFVGGPPAIAVEVLSPGTSRRDRGIKHALYDRTGVQEYWLVDYDQRTVEQRTRDRRDAGLSSVRRHNTADALLTPLLPGFSLAIARLFR